MKAVNKMLTGMLTTALMAMFQDSLEKLSEKQVAKLQKYVGKQAKKLAKKFIALLKKKQRKALRSLESLSNALVETISDKVENTADKISQVDLVSPASKLLSKAKNTIS